MKRILLFTVCVALFIFSIYLLLPAPGFPLPPPNTLTSTEPADTETPNRRSFYSQLSRSEIMDYYQHAYPHSLRINHPPEESFTLIRDQTRSSWLEELYYPWKDSFYINGFYPTSPTEQINIHGTHYANKITVRLMPTHAITRLTVLAMTAVVSYLLFKEYAKS